MKKPPAADEPEKIVCRNRKATHNFEIIERIEAGLVLTGTEVKSLRQGTATLEDGFARVEHDEVWLYKTDIPIYAMGNRMNHEPRRKRKALLHRAQIRKLRIEVDKGGVTLVPLRLYFLRGRVKIELGLARGKKDYDKRESLKQKSADKEIRRGMGVRRNLR